MADARDRRRKRPRALGWTAMGAVLAAGASAGVVALDLGGDATDAVNAADRDLVLPAAADTFVIREEPDAVRGASTVANAASWPDWHTEGYLAFTVPAGTPRFRSARLELVLDRLEHLPKSVELRELPAGWTEGDTTWRNRPSAGARLATVPLTPGRARVSVDVSRYVTRPGTHAFAIIDPHSWSAARFRTKESGAGPRLVLSGAAPATTAPNPSPTRTASPPVSTPTPGAEPTWSVPPTTGRPTSGTGGPTLCGVSLELKSGQTHLEALREADARYGRLGMVRDFYTGLPKAWPGRFGSDTRPTVVSFKMSPRDVIAGKHDRHMESWFKGAPTNRDVYWVFYHEPEDNIAKGEFSAADYRAAWRHLRKLADRAGNPRLKATLVLMGWSLEPKSGRNWRDYYPGRDVVQVLGWDVYNLAKKGYQSPAEMYGRVVSVSRAEGLPFGVAETGSYLMSGDGGKARAAWLDDMASYLEKQKALWVAYFDLNWPSGDFRLRDAPGVSAWREFC